LITNSSEVRPTSASLPPSAFASLGLHPSLLRALAAEGYETPSPIQEKAIPHLLRGLDLLGCAQTGTGKTAAFLLPLLDRFAREERTRTIRALVLAPTRELAAQIGERAGAYGASLGVRHTVIFGGVGQRPQEEALRRGPELVVATPGRLLDLIAQKHVILNDVEYFVLDEADRMLDMGFIHDVRRVIRCLPRDRQTVLFSATLPPTVLELAKGLLHEPVSVSVAPPSTTAERVTQSVYFVPRADKRNLLMQLLRSKNATRSLVFTRTKHGANKIAEQLTRAGFVAAAIHGNKSQGARERALEGFRAGSVPVLVATDIAARGIDVDGVSHVFNFDLPHVPESYVHRIGRTGRAAASGEAISLCDPAEEKGLLIDIERLIKQRIPVGNAA
jgi:ATP-dependent RNA helicase RhlE